MLEDRLSRSLQLVTRTLLTKCEEICIDINDLKNVIRDYANDVNDKQFMERAEHLFLMHDEKVNAIMNHLQAEPKSEAQADKEFMDAVEKENKTILRKAARRAEREDFGYDANGSPV